MKPDWTAICLQDPTALISPFALCSNWLTVSFWTCELVSASHLWQWQGAASNLGVRPACLCGVNSVVTVDEAGGALQSPESSSFHRATAPNMLYKIRDTNLHGSESFFFYCWCNYQKCALLNVSHTHMLTAFWAPYQSAGFDGGALRWYLILIFREELTGAGRNNTLSDTTSKLPRHFCSN